MRARRIPVEMYIYNTKRVHLENPDSRRILLFFRQYHNIVPGVGI